MKTFLTLVAIGLFGVLVWYFRAYAISTIRYKEARAAEIKRRLQVEHKNEEALKHNLAAEQDDDIKLKMELRASHERHQRAVSYVIEDMFERYQ